jgi:hypothetical protein
MWIKQRIALLLVVALGIQLLAATAGSGRIIEAASASVNNIWSEDFESYTSGSVPPGFEIQKVSGTDATVTQEVYAGTGTKSVKLADNSTTGKVSLMKTIVPTKDVVLELDVRASNWLEIHLREGTLSGPRLVLKQTGILEYYRTDIKKYTRLGTVYSTTEWNRIRIEVDNTAHRYDVYLNGVLIGEDLVMDSAINQVDNLFVPTNNSITNTSYLDNIHLYTYRSLEAPGNFSLVSPADGAEQVDLSPTLSWTVSENVYNYQVIVADNPQLTSPVREEQVGAGDTSYLLTGLSPDKTYYWSVIAENGSGITVADQVYSFQTKSTRNFIPLWTDDFEAYPLGEMPSEFQYLIPSGSSTAVTDMKSSVPGTKSLQIVDGSTQSSVVRRSFTAVQDVILEMDVYVDNWLEIHLRNGTLSGPRFYFKNNGILEYYRTEEKKFTRILQAYVINQWNRLRIETNSASHSYNVYLNGLRIGHNLPMDHPIESLDNLHISTNTAVANTVYLDNMQVSGVPFPPKPIEFKLVSPGDGATDIRLPAEFQWNTHQEADSYVLTISRNEDFTTPTFEANVGNVTEMQVPDLDFTTTYYWKVSAVTANGTVDAASAFSLTTERKRVLLWADDFEAYPLDTAPTAYELSVAQGSTALISDKQFSGSGNRSLEITDRNESLTMNLKKTFNSVRDVILEMDVYTDNWLEIHLREGTSSGPRFYLKNYGILQYYQIDSNQFTTLPATYNTNQWNRLRIETKSATHSYRVYLNNVQIGGDLPMSESIDAIDNLYITTNNRLNQYTAYIDNLQIHGYRKEGAPDDFSLLGPVNQESQIEKTITLSWSPSHNAEQYRVIAARNRELANPIADVLIGSDATSLTVQQLVNNAQYYWKVIAINPIAETDSMEVFSFSTITTVHPLEISLLSITDGTRSSVDNLESSRFIHVEGKVLNQTDEAVVGIIAAALYAADDTLVDLTFLEKSIPGRGEERILSGFSLPADSQGYYLKLFAWDLLGEMNLVSNEIRYPYTTEFE